MIDCRQAGPQDVALLAQMNRDLIHDEGHRNPMTLAELEERMAGWLQGKYEAVIFAQDGDATGYALYRRSPEYVCLRHFYVRPECRRLGIGRAALAWLRQNTWRDAHRVRVDVLVHNATGIAFWRAVGFSDYALTLEMDL
jgi:GNAT superfamily N-acetyltransferase